MEASRPGGAIVKVIIEAALLTDDEKVKACVLAKAAGADFVKTSTGFGPGGATAADVALMRRVVGPDMGVKAAGGVRDLKSARAMLEAGADRIGASVGVKIVQESQGATVAAGPPGLLAPTSPDDPRQVALGRLPRVEAHDARVLLEEAAQVDGRGQQVRVAVRLDVLEEADADLARRWRSRCRRDPPRLADAPEVGAGDGLGQDDAGAGSGRGLHRPDGLHRGRARGRRGGRWATSYSRRRSRIAQDPYASSTRARVAPAPPGSSSE